MRNYIYNLHLVSLTKLIETAYNLIAFILPWLSINVIVIIWFVLAIYIAPLKGRQHNETQR